ncbi:aminotransferase class V-fold PLP-dependent enzyme [Microbacterium schleiferi]|uniref:aminotransferase class V-fold PLP-dependent enzyme n=1 Tax=Microbacterium schleiferi TaxID=69362 RepID=UPI001E451C37|nr:aminotransferase class V-fold PLP-dependent enzyme [Microbacterium schleiferi]
MTGDITAYIESFDSEPGYLDWAAFGPLSPVVRSEVHADAELLGTGRRSSVDLVNEHVDQSRTHAASVLGVPAEQIVIQPSTSHGLQQAIYGLSGTLLLSRAEYPALTIAAARAEAALGTLRAAWLEPEHGFMTPDAVRDALTDEVTAVAVSLVDFRTGYRADLGALRDVIGDRLLIVDAIQGLGVVDADYGVADVVCANGYKWLRAGRGTGVASYSQRAVDRLAPCSPATPELPTGCPWMRCPSHRRMLGRSSSRRPIRSLRRAWEVPSTRSTMSVWPRSPRPSRRGRPA